MKIPARRAWTLFCLFVGNLLDTWEKADRLFNEINNKGINELESSLRE